MSKNQVIGIIVVLAIIVAGFFFLFQGDSPDVENITNGGQEATERNGDQQENGEGPSQNVPAPGSDVDETEVDGTVGDGAPDSASPQTVTITYTSGGFTAAQVEISVGDTVQWVNESGDDMWVASAVHPTHTVYDGTSRSQHCPNTGNTAFDQCQNGTSYSFTFDKAGEWGYHNHSRASDTGRIIVTE